MALRSEKKNLETRFCMQDTITFNVNATADQMGYENVEILNKQQKEYERGVPDELQTFIQWMCIR